MLFGDPFDHLTELDVSHTPITDRSLEAVAKGNTLALKSVISHQSVA